MAEKRSSRRSGRAQGLESFLPDQHQGLDLAGAPPKIMKARKASEENATTGLETATRGKFADCLPVQLAIPAGSKQRQRGERHGMIGKEERNSHKTGFTERREKARACERHEVLRGGKKRGRGESQQIFNGWMPLDLC